MARPVTHRAPTSAEVQELLRYDPATGLFTWRVTLGGNAAGNRAGYHKGRGYIGVGIRRGRYLAHRVAWLCVHGEWPSDELDHINGNRSDNRIANLRECNHQQNQGNRGARRNESGFKGVRRERRVFGGRQKWCAFIGSGGKTKHLGTFTTREHAAMAYNVAAHAQWGKFARPNFPVSIPLPNFDTVIAT